MKKIIILASLILIPIFISGTVFAAPPGFNPSSGIQPDEAPIYPSSSYGQPFQAPVSSSNSFSNNSSGGGISSGCSNITSLDGVVSCISGFFNAAIYLLMSFALLYTVWSALQFIRADGDSRDDWRDKIVAGIIGLFVMSAIWGLVGILSGTFNLSNNPVTPPKIGK